MRLPKWAETRYDNLGNLIVTVGTGAPSRLVAAPVDEYGYVVSEIRADGFIRIHLVQTFALTPLYHQFHEGQPVFITTEKGIVSGVTATLSTHLQRTRPESSDRRITQQDDLWVDIGARSREEVEAAGVRLLDPISLRERATCLGQHQVSGIAAGIRGGVAALLSLIDRTTPEQVTGSLTIAFVTQDLFGRRGIERIAREVKAEEAIIITSGWPAPSAANNERDSLGRVGLLGNGPLVIDNDSYWGDSAPLQRIKAFNNRTSLYTDGPDFTDVKLHLIGLPVLYVGTTVETVDRRDVQQLASLISAKVLKTSSSEGSLSAATNLIKSSPRENNPTPIIKLVNSYGVSGFERPVTETVKSMLPGWAKPVVDERGNLIVTAGQGNTHLVFVAHLDEIGYVISAIKEDGSATVEKRGGFYDTLFESHTMFVHSASGKISCVVAPRKDYWRADKRGITPQELSLYFGTTTKADTEALGVKVGDSVTMPKEYNQLTQNRASGRSFDDRMGCAALVMALTKLAPARLKNRVTFVWSVEEELGLNGAKVVADRMREDVNYVFAVDTFVSSDSPMESSRFANTPIGKGAVVRALDNSNIVPREVLNRVLAIARQRKVPVQYGVTGGGNDGAVFTQYGAIDVPISWPLRYSHSPAEVIDLRDLDALADLVRAISEEF